MDLSSLPHALPQEKRHLSIAGGIGYSATYMGLPLPLTFSDGGYRIKSGNAECFGRRVEQLAIGGAAEVGSRPAARRSARRQQAGGLARQQA
jgi:hypothetical protein